MQRIEHSKNTKIVPKFHMMKIMMQRIGKAWDRISTMRINSIHSHYNQPNPQNYNMHPTNQWDPRTLETYWQERVQLDVHKLNKWP